MSSRPGRLLVAAMFVGASAFLSVPASATPPHGLPRSADARCNGSARLCDRSLGEVAFATTHNSMSSPADRFRGPNQGKPMRWQLEHGFRGFQIDAYEGVPVGARVWTVHSGRFGSQETDLPAPLVEAAKRVHESIDTPPPGSPSDVYLCHTFCEIGAVSMDAIAKELRDFLDRHPREVLVLVIEDHVAPARLMDVFRRHGLERELVTATPGSPLPTLGDLVDARTRLLVTLENGDGGSKLPNAFTGLVEETPFTFLKATSLARAASCAPNRGTDASPIFQFNHWVTPPVPKHARLVNGRVLGARVARCTRARRPPTLVAVDFADQSDVLGVVRRLNHRAHSLEMR